MQLFYVNTTKDTIACHLDAGEALGDHVAGEVPETLHIKVDGQDPNYRALIEADPYLETVMDPNYPIPAAGPADFEGAKQGREQRAQEENQRLDQARQQREQANEAAREEARLRGEQGAQWQGQPGYQGQQQGQYDQRGAPGPSWPQQQPRP